MSASRPLLSLPALLVLFSGCQELGLNKEPEAPAPTVAETPAAQAPVEPTVDFSSMPVIGADGKAVGGPALSPEQFVAQFATRDSAQLTDADLRQLADATPFNAGITELNLRGARITQDGLSQLARMPNVKKVDLTGCGVAGAGWAGLSTATQLEDLILEAAHLEDATMAALAPLTNLKRLNISRTAVTDNGFQHLTGMTRLESINCMNTQITGGGFEAFTAKYAKSPLKEIYVTNSNFAMYGFNHIQGLASLEVLAAGAAGVTENVLVALKGCRDMKVLHLGKSAISDKALVPVINGMDDLVELDISDSNLISDYTLEKLRGHKALKKLVVNSTACTEKGVMELKKSLPECSIVYNNRQY
jgi:hypothetical protein